MSDEIETPRLRLRVLCEADTDRAFAMSRDPLLVRFLPDQVYRDEAHAAAVVRALIAASVARDPRVRPYVMGVVLRDGGELVGHVGFSAVPDGVEIGYAIDERFNGRGMASEAVGAAARWALATFGLDAVLGIVEDENPASIRVLEKSGFIDRGDRTASGKRVYRFGLG
ncbi:MAG: GNAT family N-acetyltransferase [Kofleriaceae bacterium]